MRPSTTSWHLFLRAVCALALTLLVACGSDSDLATGDDETSDDETSDSETADETTVDDGGEPIPIDLDALGATSWTLRFGGGPDGDIPILEEWPITISFDDGTISGTAACNSYGGMFDIDGSEIFLDGIFFTEMGCEPDVMASESAYLAALLDVGDINLIGNELALGGMSTELIFAPAE